MTQSFQANVVIKKRYAYHFKTCLLGWEMPQHGSSLATEAQALHWNPSTHHKRLGITVSGTATLRSRNRQILDSYDSLNGKLQD